MSSLFYSAILGLTVLAIGNSVGDWVADTAVARAGEPGMGVASCFGSPLLNDVLGLSIALMVSDSSSQYWNLVRIRNLADQINNTIVVTECYNKLYHVYNSFCEHGKASLWLTVTYLWDTVLILATNFMYIMMCL